MQSEDLNKCLDALADELNVLRREFTRRAWELVRADSPDAEQAALGSLREVAAAMTDPKARETELHQMRKANSKIGVKGVVSPEAQARMQANDHAQAEIKRQRLAAEKAAYDAKIEAGRLAEARRKRLAAEREAEEIACLAAEEKRDKIIQQAISAGRLTAVVETREQRIANDQRRSNGGIVRLESGDGR